MSGFHSNSREGFTDHLLQHFSLEDIQKLDHEVEYAGAPLNYKRREELDSANKEIISVLRHLLDRYGDLGLKVFNVGSFAADLCVGESDIDLSISSPHFENWVIEKLKKKNSGVWPTTSEMKIRCLEGVKYEIENYQKHQSKKVYVNLEVIGKVIPVLKLFDTVSNVNIDIVFDGKDALRNTQFLLWNAQLSPRFATLYRAIKNWAKCKKVLDASHGKLSSFSLGLLVIQFLQDGLAEPVLPCLHTEFPHLRNLLEDVENIREDYHLHTLGGRGNLSQRWSSKNTMSLGVLFHLFFEYYRFFDFDHNYVCVRAGKPLRRGPKQKFASNRKDTRKHLMVVEDPFIVPSRNTSATVMDHNSFLDITESIQDMRQLIKEEKTIFSKKNGF